MEMTLTSYFTVSLKYLPDKLLWCAIYWQFKVSVFELSVLKGVGYFIFSYSWFFCDFFFSSESESENSGPVFTKGLRLSQVLGLNPVLK